jgi:hypothetical protein
MIIGVDLDNTVICYDSLFHRLGREMGGLPPAVAAEKTAIRDWFRAQDREAIWTEMQALAYGDRLPEATAFPDAVVTLLEWVAAGHEVAIISHKTRTPYRGAPCDLHGAARRWLLENGLAAIPAFLEETREGKMRRIGVMGCALFVDDLPEFLGDPSFPSGVERLLFDPNRNWTPPSGSALHAVSSWQAIARHVANHRTGKV